MGESFYKPLDVCLQNVVGIQESMEAMRLPFNSSTGDTKNGILGPKDAHLAGKLIRAGNDHAKAIRGIIAYMTLKMQTGFMIEFETYRHGVECLSTSSAMHNDLKGLSGESLASKKQEDLPNKVYERSLHISYQALRGIYFARRNHKHPDWLILCSRIENLPYFNELILAPKNNK